MSGEVSLTRTRSLLEEISHAMAYLEPYLSDQCAGAAPAITAQTRRVILAGGKRLRPRLAWLCGRIGGASTEELLPLMAILELMHTASLIHDDVVDGADKRRGAATIHTQLGARGAVQCGDFLLSRAMSLLSVYQGTGIGPAIAETFSEMCRGELEQSLAVRKRERQTTAGYFRQIRRKTACLLSVCCRAGALAGGLSPAEVQILGRYGLHLGIAFQLRDDLLDFAPACQTGKPRGQDLRRGIYTLPVLYALRRDPSLSQTLSAPVSGERELEVLLDRVICTGALEYAQCAVQRAADAALAVLSPISNVPEAELLASYASALSHPKTAAILRTEDVPS